MALCCSAKHTATICNICSMILCHTQTSPEIHEKGPTAIGFKRALTVSDCLILFGFNHCLLHCWPPLPKPSLLKNSFGSDPSNCSAVMGMTGDKCIGKSFSPSLAVRRKIKTKHCKDFIKSGLQDLSLIPRGSQEESNCVHLQCTCCDLT